MRIDAFAHALPPRYRARVTGLLEARGDETARQYAWMLGNDPTLTDLGARFALMDEISADYRQVLVMGHTSLEGEEPDVALDLAEIGNEELPRAVAAHPDRFAGWVAETALQAGDRGLEVIQRAIAHGALGAHRLRLLARLRPRDGRRRRGRDRRRGDQARRRPGQRPARVPPRLGETRSTCRGGCGRRRRRGPRS